MTSTGWIGAKGSNALGTLGVSHQLLDELGVIDDGSTAVTVAFEDPSLRTKVFGEPLPMRGWAVIVVGRVSNDHPVI